MPLSVLVPLTIALLAVIYNSKLITSAAKIRTAKEVLYLGEYEGESNPNQLRICLSISAQHRYLEVSWKNAPALPDDYILLTSKQPQSFVPINVFTDTPLEPYANMGRSGYVPVGDLSARTNGDVDDNVYHYANTSHLNAKAASNHQWISDNGENKIIAALQPRHASAWFTTGVHFDLALSYNVTIKTKCYGYWASYVNQAGTILASTCLRAYPRWMSEMHSVVGAMRLRDLFIPGTHDSGSYRTNFDPLLQETIVTKYALTQDLDIHSQLMHGVRYLDIRVGYYRNTPEQFFNNHGVIRQGPLLDIIEQVKDFVLETNEIVIFGIKEFPVGFGNNLSVHRLLVSFLKEHFGDLIVHPSLTWSASLCDIWSRQQNVILAYDKSNIVQEFPQILFDSVEQRWGNVQNWTLLERHLRAINKYDTSRLTSRPVCDMAELTPDTWGVFLDKYGGLRKMADHINWRITQLYRSELGEDANIVAVDFLLGTNIVEIALEWNKRKVIC